MSRHIVRSKAWMDCWPTLGSARMQLDSAHRGFSFQADGPLDMRMDPRRGANAEQVVNQADEKVLADLIYEFGEEGDRGDLPEPLSGRGRSGLRRN